MDFKAQILEDTFKNSFEMERYQKFIKEFFNMIEIVAPNTKIRNYSSEFAYTISGHIHVANYADSQNKRIAILAIQLNAGRKAERARSIQRNFVSKLISNSGYDAAIAAFYIEGDPKWRLSFVRLDQEWIGGGKVKTTITPAKRFSYLVGEKEPSHTAQEQLFPIFRNEDYNPTLDKIEEAFSVETVTNEFFVSYKSKYHDLREHLEKDENFIKESDTHNFSSEQFAKKVMGQLAFLYFLQKKGWLGVKVVPKIITEKQYKNAFYRSNASKAIIGKMYEQKDNDSYRLRTGMLLQISDEEADILASCFTPEAWGSGTKSFIYDLFKDCKQYPDKNFFEDYLEPLFYEALRLNRGASQYYKRFNCKIPFLNGGLFDPLENYDWKHSSFNIPDIMFSNEDEKGKRDCDGILDVFERYNFTMNEDEPLEREVAVDPEMLGKIFENLLDVTDRKSKGAFYTPREIVHYMCQESIIKYLVNEIKISYEDVKQFILYGEIMKDEDCTKNIDIFDDTKRQMPNSVFINLHKIDDALKTIRVADPAVGSGAFPLGMLSEIVRARNIITDYNFIQINNEDKKLQSRQRAQYKESRNPYSMKWNTIKNCIYAVDIEASAVDIAKLRLWLALVVDEDLEPTYDEKFFGISTHKDPKPLPNLDYNIMCGNSLIDEFEGIKLFDDSIVDKENSSSSTENNFQFNWFKDQITTLTEHLFEQQDRLFGENNSENKTAIKKSIDKTIDDIIRAKLSRDGNEEALKKYEESIKQKTRPYFLWKLEFAKVFKEKGGFDVVIGNPPYIQLQKKSGHLGNQLEKQNYKVFERTGDIYCLFYEQGLNILKQNGNLCYITSNKWLRAGYGKKLRCFLSKLNPCILINLGPNIFKSATVDTNILLVENSKNKDEFYALSINNTKENLGILFDQNKTKQSNINNNPWFIGGKIDVELKKKLEKLGKPLKEWDISIYRGILTGLNEAFVINQFEYDEIVAKDSNSTQILKPILRGRDIGKYVHHWAGLYLIQTDYDIDIPNKYPVIFEHLLKFKDKAEKRYDKGKNWWNLRSCHYYDEFAKEKLIWQEITIEPCFAFDNKGTYCNDTGRIMTFKNIKFFVGFFNSIFFKYIFSHYYSGGELGAKGIRFKHTFMLDVPVTSGTNDQENKITNIVDKILDLKQSDPSADILILQKEIDKIIYKIYNLTEEEIKLVEGI